MKLKLFPRRLASLTLAIATVPGVAPLTAAGQAPVPTPMPMIPAPAPGGWTRQSPDAPSVRLAATFAVTVLGREFGHPYVVERISRAESQVVEGADYRVRMRIAEVQDSILGARKDCTVVVWSRPWLKPADVLTSFDCQAVDSDS
ncbi:cystatin domain-containing protein [Actinospica sp.]|jgi:hypothetical protein|uniref:cystatin domain-containing protein n=1 Tax=Actinospica sp. TaxID=1872142 RepID=UPI002B639FB5|nr:cystatin domain-containing protein [Actinospica sp.]HWG22560.1 cystatin domain-containing protein [Actinospica sp.]